MARTQNPFSDSLAAGNSNYTMFKDGHLIHPGTDAPPSRLTRLVHDELRALVLNDHFSCLGGKASLRHGSYRFGFYSSLGSDAATAGLAHDLFEFVRETQEQPTDFSTYLASFSGPTALDEGAFEQLLWQTLQRLHDNDADHHEWDPTVSANPSDPNFSFSYGGMAFFVVGLHAASSRVARRFAWPTLVFNPHRQFVALKDSGRYARLQQVIRTAEEELQGNVNPMLADHGTRSEATQYSGRKVDASSWHCPFHAHHKSQGVSATEQAPAPSLDDDATADTGGPSRTRSGA